jgi:predicted Zn-dependent protease
MAVNFDTRLAFQSILVGASIFAVYGFSPDSGEKDSRVQSRLYSHLDHADRCVANGNTSEAIAYAEMVLLRREITVYVDESKAPWQIKEDAAKALRDAAINWEDALNREIKFRFVPFRDADVIIGYADGVRFDGKEAAGTVRWTRQVMNLGSNQYHYEVRANITLRAHTPAGSMMSYRQMLHTAGHELGHVLGLEDSVKQGDLMGPLRLDRPVERAAKAERDSLLSVRRQAGDILARVNSYDKVAVRQDYDNVIVQVVSEPSEKIEARKPSVRNVRGQRRPALVRSSVRDKQTEPREKVFKIGGMAR